MADTTTDSLARFLPAHCDARLISHYLSLLADSEARLKHQLSAVRQELQQLRQTATQSVKQSAKAAAPEKPLVKLTQKSGEITQKSFSCRKHDDHATMAAKAYKRGIQLFEMNDLTNAIPIFEQARAWLHPDAENMLGECYYFAQQFENALKWYEQAAQKNHVDALYSSGYMYYHGEGTHVNHEKAIDFLKRAAAAGVVDAINLLRQITHR